MTLEAYLADQYNRDLQDVTSIEEVLVEVGGTFARSYDADAGCWPYRLQADVHKVEGALSHGTSAMILAAIGKILGCCSLRDDSAVEKINGLPDELFRVFDYGSLALVGQLKNAKKAASSTFGDNNPLTLSHLTELARGLEGRLVGGEAFADVIRRLPGATKKIAELMAKSPSSLAFIEALGDQPYVRSAFLALRAVRARTDIDPDPNFKNELYKDFFELRLHEQLSFSSIPDSRFDPAELAFCLEGLLTCAPEAVDPVLFERVFAVMGTKQETSAYWRPSRPFLAERTGKIILPLSVEGANSLLRSVEIMDGARLYGTFAATAVPMFRRFWQWLRARKVEIYALHNTCIGWHSEHINETGVVDLWDTSQVVEFLLSFRQLLLRHIARETLVLSRVKIDNPKRERAWQKITADFEPLTDHTIAQQGRVFDLVLSEFIEPWRARATPRKYSMLLYGPPGTGKTTIASSIADALTFRLVTVTVGDFLGGGGALVEARAKAIFQMLEAQSDCVIFFDEIDAFLLDRDSKHYREQDTLFKFLTPGMLTKINDLRKVERSIFIIATNYANRIDPAIKRPGRIDRQYLLLPPDIGKRNEIIRAKLLKKFGPTVAADLASHVHEMAKVSLYLGYNEIIGAIDQSGREASDILNELRKTPPSTGHQLYLARLMQETTFPMDEFVAIVRMAEQADNISNVSEAIASLSAEEQRVWSDLTNRSPNFAHTLSELGVQV
jgi:hypothetical protein